MKNKLLTWEEEPYVKGITAFNDDKERLGWLQLENVGRHRHWCWYQYDDIRMSPGYLEEVRVKQKELFQDRKTK